MADAVIRSGFPVEADALVAALRLWAGHSEVKGVVAAVRRLKPGLRGIALLLRFRPISDICGMQIMGPECRRPPRRGRTFLRRG